MTPERWQEIKTVLQSALERPPEEREQFLRQACGGDEPLRREVGSLIAYHERAGGFIDEPAVGAVAGLVAGEGPSELPAGSSLGPYRVISKIGEGGMGEVYLAEDTRLGRRVALKLLPPQFTQDRERLRRFQQEARAASALNHPNIITIYEIGQAGASHFIATELIEGETLRARMTRAPLSLAEALDVAVQIAAGLAAAHRAGLVHRDVKPENVMLRSEDSIVKVLDFGLVKLVGSQPTSDEAATIVNTDAGVIMGTAYYMSPEQVRALRVDERTDVWSLGAVLYEMVAGRVPFPGGTSGDVLAMILQKDPVPLARYAPGLPAEIERIVAKALRKDCEERYQTVKDLSIDLRNLRRTLEHEQELERSTAPPGVGAVTAAAGTTRSAAAGAPVAAAKTGRVEVAHPTSSAEYIIGEIRQHKTGAVVAAAVVVLALVGGGILAAFKFLRPAGPAGQTAAPAPAMRIARLTSNGRADQAAISPDGKYVVHVASEDGRQSLRVRQVNIASDEQVIVPAAEARYSGLTFSPDGELIYYVVSEKNNLQSSLYRVPALGGTPRKSIQNIGGAVTFSPDGKRVAFIRDGAERGEQALTVASAEGGGERQIAVRKFPNFFRSVSWSSDGGTLACGVGSYVPNFNSYVVVIPAEGGAESRLSAQAWFSMGQVAWLADGSGLVVNASELSSGSFDSLQLWYLSYPGGEVRRVTNDLNNYAGASLTADSGRLVTVQSETISNIWVVPQNDAARAEQATNSPGKREGLEGVAWTPDGRIVYASKASGSDDIWIMDADGGGKRQLTSNAGINTHPAVSPDGRYVVFTSTRTGAPHIWRMGIDGGDPKQLTSGSGENYAQVSPDGKWVVYTLFAGTPSLWRISIEGGAPAPVSEGLASAPAVSPDGKWVASVYWDGEPNSPARLALTPFEGGAPAKVFDVPSTDWSGVRWAPDGRSLTYIATVGGVSNVWGQPVGGGVPRQLTNFKTDQIFWFDWSRDGRQIACARGAETNDVVVISNFR